MKTLKQFKHAFFTFLMLIVMIVSFNGCDKDDDDITDAKTFLELYTGTTWELNNDGGVPADADVPAYFRFIDDATKVLEGWYQDPIENECYYYAEGINIDNGSMTLLENSENKIVIKISYTNETETYTCTVQADTVKIVMVYEEVGFPSETYTLYFDKTTVNVDGLTLCPA